MAKNTGPTREAAPAGQFAALLERLYPVEELFAQSGEKIEIAADQAECAALAKFFGVEKLISLKADLIPHAQGKSLHITGWVKAKLIQTCVVTLEPFENKVEEPVDVRFSGEKQVIAASREALPGNEAEWDDPPEPLPHDNLDLGGLVAEHLALGIDPYPRSSGAVFDTGGVSEPTEKPDSPFAALQGLKIDGKK